MKSSNINISRNLMTLRQNRGYTLEYVAEEIGVSRQAVSKWESGTSVPDIENSNKLAKLYNVSLDDLINYEQYENERSVPEVGKHIFGIVQISEKGQIVIPKKAREIFNIRSGDSLLILGDSSTPGKTGIAIVKADEVLNDIQIVKNMIKEGKNDE